VALLIDRFERAAGGEGQTVLLSGEAGIGKSRLYKDCTNNCRLFCTRRLDSHAVLASSRQHTLTPVFRQLEYAAGFLPEDAPAAKLSKLETLLQQGVDDVAQGMVLLAPLLSLPASDRYGRDRAGG